jgi:hypothetical protein
MAAKEKHKETLIQYCGDPSNDFPTRKEMALDVLGFKKQETLWFHFTPDELCEIERDALELRRKKYNPEIAKVDLALMKKAAGGNVAAAKLIYQRFEGWSEKQIREHEIGDSLSSFLEKIDGKGRKLPKEENA